MEKKKETKKKLGKALKIAGGMIAGAGALIVGGRYLCRYLVKVQREENSLYEFEIRKSQFEKTNNPLPRKRMAARAMVYYGHGLSPEDKKKYSGDLDSASDYLENHPVRFED